MNIHTKIEPRHSQRPAEPTRRRFTADELLAMEEAGILSPDERVELIDGEIIAMPAKSARHEDMRTELCEHFAAMRPPDVKIAQEPAFRLSDDQEPEPDILLFPRTILVSQARGDTALLVIEVAVSSLSVDLKVKAPIYATHGVREYWVVDARRIVTYVHREPGPEGYASIREVQGDERIVPLLIPSVGLALADLGLTPLPAGEDGEAD
jgi:Uma2 family endonuclease